MNNKWIVANNGVDIHTADESFTEIATVVNRRYAPLVAASPELLHACQKMIAAFNDAPSNWLQTQDVADAEIIMKQAINSATR